MTVTDLRSLSAGQNGIWFTERVGDAGSTFHVPVVIQLDGSLDIGALAGACRAVLSRHPALTCAVNERDGVPCLLPAASPPVVAFENLAQTPGGQREARMDELVREEALRTFDLSQGPLIRFTLRRLAVERFVLIIVAHHLIFDGGSKDVLVHDLAAHYNAAVGGEPMPPQLQGSTAFSDDEVPAAVRAEAQDYWRDRWHPSKEIVLPGLVPSATSDRLTSGNGRSIDVTVGHDLHEGLSTCARALAVTRFELLFGAISALLYRYGNDDFRLGVDLGTRTPRTRDRIGMFMNELPFEPTIAADVTFRKFAETLRAELRDLYRVRAVPLARAVRAVEPYAAVAPVSVSYRKREADPVFRALSATVGWDVFNLAARNPLHVLMVDAPDALTLSLRYDADVLTQADASRVARHLRAVVADVIARPDVPLAEVEILDADERKQLVVSSAPTPVPERGVGQLFEDQAMRSPDAAAVSCGEQTASYGELRTRAGRLAAELRRRGVGVESLAAVCVEPSIELLVALLAIWKVGAAYVPLDPDSPPERLAYMLDDCGASLLLTQDRLTDRFARERPVLVVDQDLPAGGDQVPDQEMTPGPDACAYVIYTSGSTGWPKGVAVSHGALANLLRAMHELLRCDHRARWLALTSLSFDISALELFLPLTIGARTVMAERRDADEPIELVRLIRSQGVTHLQATPSRWRVLLSGGFEDRAVTALVGGEALSVPLATELRARVARLINLYGPTETTIWSTAWEVPEIVDEVSLGQPIANTRVLVLDHRLEPVPIGLPGELFIGGVGLARGYLHRPGLTAERFLPDPHPPPCDRSGVRLYRTGDRVRRRTDGSLEFMGRLDDQVKLRGHRVELGEVEAVLMEHPGVDEAVAVVRQDLSSEDILVAYVVGCDGGGAPTDLRSFLAQRLPTYMLPSAFVRLDYLPCTPNGKVDRKALPDPPRPPAAGSPTSPGTGLESELAAQVAAIWCEVLGVSSVDPEADLFDLGGHSLMITQISARLRTRHAVDVPLHAFFDAPTVAGIVRQITSSQQRDP